MTYGSGSLFWKVGRWLQSPFGAKTLQTDKHTGLRIKVGTKLNDYVENLVKLKEKTS